MEDRDGGSDGSDGVSYPRGLEASDGDNGVVCSGGDDAQSFGMVQEEGNDIVIELPVHISTVHSHVPNQQFAEH